MLCRCLKESFASSRILASIRVVRDGLAPDEAVPDELVPFPLNKFHFC